MADESGTAKTGREIATIDGEFRVVKPLASAQEAVAAFQEYVELTAALLKPSDYQTYTDKGQIKRFKKKSAWRKLRRFYGFNLELREERIGHRHDKNSCPRILIPGEQDCGCPTVYARYVVRATDPRTGQYVDGIGISSLTEMKNRIFTKPDHEIPATAYTRAANRAISDIIGAGEDSAEEVRGSGAIIGLPAEDRTAIKVAWTEAAKERREAALAALREWTFTGETIAALFTDFGRRAGDEQVADLLAILTGDNAPAFDPDEIEEGAT